MPKERKQIKDFKIALKDFEPMVKDPEAYLIRGRDIPNFSLRPREAWANWLFCVVMNEVLGKDITFAEDEEGDGIILEKGTGAHIITEHVSALNVPTKEAKLKGEDRVINAIEHKIKRGPEYAEGKVLVVFMEGAGKWYPNKVGRHISGGHDFDAVYCIGLLTGGEKGYRYSVTKFGATHSLTWEVSINADFTDYKVSKIQ